jgi:hypothetical protein
MSQSICVATSYVTLGADALVDAMMESEATVIFTNQKVRSSRMLRSRMSKGTFAIVTVTATVIVTVIGTFATVTKRLTPNAQVITHSSPNNGERRTHFSLV